MNLRIIKSNAGNRTESGKRNEIIMTMQIMMSFPYGKKGE